MEGSDRDSTQDWLLSEGARPPLLSELEARIEEAVVTARASEAAVMAVGAAAIEAAEQARHAAELAERASAAMLGGGFGAGPDEDRAEPPTAATPAAATVEDESLRGFTERADRIAERLRELSPASAGAGR